MTEFEDDPMSEMPELQGPNSSKMGPDTISEKANSGDREVLQSLRDLV